MDEGEAVRALLDRDQVDAPWALRAAGQRRHRFEDGRVETGPLGRPPGLPGRLLEAAGPPPLHLDGVASAAAAWAEKIDTESRQKQLATA